jgi:hypothetical protein
MAHAASDHGAILAFPRADLRGLLNSALKRHRLPEGLAAALVRDAAKFPEVSADAAKIIHAAKLAGRVTEYARADGGLALFRTNSNPPELLTVMEADGFNPLNARAASAFSALGDIEGVETIGVVSALNDAEDVSDIVAAFRFRRVIVTNMDRTRRLGAALAATTGGARLAHVTHGPRPEDALEMLAPGALAALLLDMQAH